MKLEKNAEGSIQIVKDIKDPNALYPLTTKQVIKIVNKRLKTKEILLTKIVAGESQKKPFTTHDFQLFNSFYDIKKDNRYCYQLCNFIVEEIERSPETFVENLKKKTKK